MRRKIIDERQSGGAIEKKMQEERQSELYRIGLNRLLIADRFGITPRSTGGIGVVNEEKDQVITPHTVQSAENLRRELVRGKYMLELHQGVLEGITNAEMVKQIAGITDSEAKEMDKFVFSSYVARDMPQEASKLAFERKLNYLDRVAAVQELLESMPKLTDAQTRKMYQNLANAESYIRGIEEMEEKRQEQQANPIEPRS